MERAQDQYGHHERVEGIVLTLYENEERRETGMPNFAFCVLSVKCSGTSSFTNMNFSLSSLTFPLLPPLLLAQLRDLARIDAQSLWSVCEFDLTRKLFFKTGYFSPR